MTKKYFEIFTILTSLSIVIPSGALANATSILTLTKEQICAYEHNPEEEDLKRYAKGMSGDEYGNKQLGTIKNGEWIVKLTWGTIKGSSKCSTTPGNEKFGKGSPANTTGSSCWCKAETYTKEGETGSVPDYWYHKRNAESDNICASLCAFDCALSVEIVPAKRAIILGKQASLCPEEANTQQNQIQYIKVTGNVKDENNEAIIGVNVAVVDEKGESVGNDIIPALGTITDVNGVFVIDRVPSNAKLSISYMGYKSQTVPANSTLDIKLQEDNVGLDEIVSAAKCPTNKKCQQLPENATKGVFKNINNSCTCVPTECENGYEVKDNACVLKAEEAKQEDKPTSTVPCKVKELEKINATKGNIVDKKCVATACVKGYTLLNGSCIDEQAEQKYQDAKAKEQSMANRALTAATTAATGIGAMELAMGLSQQKADKEADADMAAYLETFRCTYGDGKSVKAGNTEIELPGGNDQTMMNYRAEYFALAADLKDRKESLGMTPGIESEIIMDKAAMGLYDDENVGITGGNYESLYRAKMLDSEEDQAKIDSNAQSAKNRVIAGAVVGGVGVVGGIVGDSLINGKLGEKIKELKNKNSSTKENNDVINTFKAGLKSAGMTNVDKLDLSKFDFASLKSKINGIDFNSLNLNGMDAKQLINTTNETSLNSSLEKLGISVFNK